MTAHTEDRCILIYPEPEWQEILPKIEALPTFNKAALRAQRLLLGYACAMELDSNGRVLVPPTLRNYANLDKNSCWLAWAKNLSSGAKSHGGPQWLTWMWTKSCQQKCFRFHCR